MKNKLLKASAAPEGADNPMVRAWLAFAAAPDLKENLDNLAVLLEADVRRRLPDNSTDRALGIEDIRQNTCLRLLNGHLAGNRLLIAATESGSPAAISAHLRTAISTALRYERGDAARRAARTSAREGELTEENGGSCQHPAGSSFWELPYSARRELALAALSQAVGRRLLTASGAALATRMIEGNLSQAEASREMGVSRQAVSQHMKKVRRHLPKIVEGMEFPIV